MRIGLEKEFFVLNQDTGEPVLCPPGVPMDECGWLAEARGNPADGPVDAIHLLESACWKVGDALHKHNEQRDATQLALVDAPVMKLPRELRSRALRLHGKGRIEYQNFYGYEHHITNDACAGIHVSFTAPIRGNDGREWNGNFDWPMIFIKLDNAFKEEIRAAKRRPGFYEVKSDGRVEYRSLPSNTDLNKLRDVLTAIFNHA